MAKITFPVRIDASMAAAVKKASKRLETSSSAVIRLAALLFIEHIKSGGITLTPAHRPRSAARALATQAVDGGAR